MIVCPCEEISEEAVRQIVRDGATRIEQVVSACKAGVYCGACVPAIYQILRHEKHLIDRSKTRTRPAR